jgi:quercetin 2,3-dioxygenase
MMTKTTAWRRGSERGMTDIGWLKSAHTFTFGEYYDPLYLGASQLRVINEDRVAGGGGFPPHPHKDMEIVSYVISGALKHEDSLGTSGIIEAGDVQRMSAGSGIRHSEMNASATESVHFLQMWVRPHTKDLAPSYAQKSFKKDNRIGISTLVLSPDGRDESLSWNQDATLHLIDLAANENHTLDRDASRVVWLQIVQGRVTLNGETGQETGEAGDGLLWEGTELFNLSLTAKEPTEILVFDLPPNLR